MRLLRSFEDGELEALTANGDGSLGGPPTGKLASCRLASLLDAREFRRSLGGGMGEGEDMAGRGGVEKACGG
jgi:hypothetical protein